MEEFNSQIYSSKLVPEKSQSNLFKSQAIISSILNSSMKMIPGGGKKPAV